MSNKEKAIATISKTKEIMETFQISTKKNFGQNFIIEPAIVEKIAASAKLDDKTAVIEIGPGIGALTEQLAKLAKTVVCFELDERLGPVLDMSLATFSNVQVIFCDFLKVDLEECVQELRKTHEKIVVCANLPYYITTPVLFHIFDSKLEIPYITVMMQKEVAERFGALPNTKDYNALSVIIQYQYVVETVMKVSKNVFLPKPNVDSIVLQFQQKKEKKAVRNEKEFFQFVKQAFTQRRKTIFNNLKSLSTNINEILIKANIEPTRRAESLSLEEFIHLFEVYDEKESICED